MSRSNVATLSISRSVCTRLGMGVDKECNNDTRVFQSSAGPESQSHPDQLQFAKLFNRSPDEFKAGLGPRAQAGLSSH